MSFKLIILNPSFIRRRAALAHPTLNTTSHSYRTDPEEYKLRILHQTITDWLALFKDSQPNKATYPLIREHRSGIRIVISGVRTHQRHAYTKKATWAANKKKSYQVIIKQTHTKRKT